jgi:hypothetical protein
MALLSIGYGPSERERQKEERELQLFSDNLPLIRAHENDILSCADYFFCPLSFAWCSWPYITGDGPLCLGYLLLGWRDGNLTATCGDCGGRVLVVNFRGSFLSGDGWWYGICETCRAQKKGYWTSFSVQTLFIC